jgi:hypothetical protein
VQSPIGFTSATDLAPVPLSSLPPAEPDARRRRLRVPGPIADHHRDPPPPPVATHTPPRPTVFPHPSAPAGVIPNTRD